MLAGGSLSSSDLELFNQLLYCDVVRGVHATGVFAKRPGQECRFAKAAEQPYPFMQSVEYKELSEGTTKYVVPPTFLVGHNRHATRGNSGDSKNAHPFQHGHITLVHNGTLTDQGLLPESARFVVDSDNIAYSISKIGAAETIQKLDGAFTLIWHDASDDTVHIIRNDERPFHLAQIGQADWFGASEEDMLMWLLKRSKVHKNRITKHFECEVGHEYIFDVSGVSKRFVLKEVVEHKLPTFTLASRYYSNGYSRSYYPNRTTTSSTTSSSASTTNSSAVKVGREAAKANEREKQNNVAIEAGIEARIDQRIQMTPHSWFPYSTGVSGKGRITGWVMDGSEYYEVDVHSVDQAMFEDCMDDLTKSITGIVVNISKVNGMIRVILAHPSIYDSKNPLPALPAPSKEPALANPDDVPFETDDILDILDDLPDAIDLGGITMSRVQYSKHDHSKCGGCDQHIPWKDVVAKKAIFAYNCIWHEKCLASLLDDEAGGHPSDTFLCCACGKEHGMAKLDSTESARRGEDLCIDCGEHIRARRVEEAKKNIAKEYGEAPKWDNSTDLSPTVLYLDKTTNAIINDEDGVMSKTFTRKEFDNMIRMRGSDKAKFEQIQECYIEKRSSTIFAYRFKRSESQALKAPAKEEKTTAKVVNFPQRNGTTAGLLSSNGTVNSKPVSESGTLSLQKVLKNGQKELRISKALWSQIGQCNNCYAIIPWRDVEGCALNAQNRVICPNCRGS